MTRRPFRVVGDGPIWAPLLRRATTGNPHADLRNTLIVLRNDPALDAVFAFDEMHQAIKVLAEPPLAPGAERGAKVPRFADPEDVTRLVEWLQHVAMPKLARDHVEHALEEFARERPIHPLRDWLNMLEEPEEDPILWDWLTPALGCPNDEYHRLIGGMFIIAMVARVMDPGCQADYMIVLEGPQGELKSQFCRELAGDEYFSDSLPRLEGDHVRVSMHLRGKWLIEISELSAFSKAEAGALKAFITRREEIYTPKYGRKERREPRQCLFIGTTNDDEYIRDDTGGRRYWPVKVFKVDLDWLRAHRTQLFAEGVQAWNHNAAWWPDRSLEKTMFAPIQAERQVFDEWTPRVLEAVENVAVTTIAAIWTVISASTGVDRLGMPEQKRISNILKINGYKKDRDAKGRKIWRKS